MCNQNSRITQLAQWQNDFFEQQEPLCLNGSSGGWGSCSCLCDSLKQTKRASQKEMHGCAEEATRNENMYAQLNKLEWNMEHVATTQSADLLLHPHPHPDPHPHWHRFHFHIRTFSVPHEHTTTNVRGVSAVGVMERPLSTTDSLHFGGPEQRVLRPSTRACIGI